MESVLSASQFEIQAILWPFVLLVGWWIGERLNQSLRLPRAGVYAITGLIAGLFVQPDALPGQEVLSFVANVALAILLFELGLRINLLWFRKNPWILAIGIVQSVLCVLSSWVVLGWFIEDSQVRMIASALTIAASPAAVVTVIREMRSSGQVTERTLHVCAITSLLAAVALKVVIGQWHLTVRDDWAGALGSSLYAISASVAAGVIAGFLINTLRSPDPRSDASVVHALTLLLLTACSLVIFSSPLLAALTCGMTVRRISLKTAGTPVDFASLGRLTALFLFVYVAWTMPWPDSWQIWLLGLVLLPVRIIVLAVTHLVFSRLSGVSMRKGLLTALALTPISVYAILLIEHAHQSGVTPAQPALYHLAAMIALLEITGPLIIQLVITFAGEASARRSTAVQQQRD
jgi:Kef-type K+ transport system membrane component KefB